MKIALLVLIFVASASPALADPQITCETVRAYASQVGLMQAKAQARAAGHDRGARAKSKTVPCEEGLISPKKSNTVRPRLVRLVSLDLKLFLLKSSTIRELSNFAQSHSPANCIDVHHRQRPTGQASVVESSVAAPACDRRSRK